jgi:tRNA threonylcarbamoyladenosine biosynthesis protein TsaB
MSKLHLLAIETATEACSAALLVGDAVLERCEIAPRRHAELILPMIDALLAEAGIGKHMLDGIAVGRGPGAFTGVRLAISIAQGLALGLDRPVVAVSSLAALAQQAPRGDDDTAILATIDARMGEIYAGAYRVGAGGLVEPIAAETVTPASALVLPARRDWIVVGSGWSAYADALAQRLPGPPRFADGTRLPRAAAIVRLAAAQFAAGHAGPAETALPVYLRDKVALTLEEQRAR